MWQTDRWQLDSKTKRSLRTLSPGQGNFLNKLAESSLGRLIFEFTESRVNFYKIKNHKYETEKHDVPEQIKITHVDVGENAHSRNPRY